MKKLTYEEIKSSCPTIEKLKAKRRFPIYGILDNIRSMYNVGSVFRTSDASRIEQLILCGMTAHPPRKEIDKTALGSVESVPWIYYQNTVDAVRKLKANKVNIVVVEHTSKSVDYRSLNLSFPMGLIFGHEVYGVNDEVIAMADSAIVIPMYGIKQSLNLAVAYGIVLYHFVHKYVELEKVELEK